MKFLVEGETQVKEENVFDDIRALRRKLGSKLVLDEMLEELSYERLQEFVAYMKKKYKKVLEEE